ncbi:MAG: FAD binding domain-containing protein [Chloroflexota bacterium]|nr:FAD binding domain-containing protein [Chloroflexota bacterium]MEC9438401.1 FAD binding domain-containing protein [Chloroflexota bacterium]
MKWIDFEKPNTVEDAVKLLSDSGGNARAMAGGTDLIVMLRVGHPRVNPDVVVDIKSIPELNELSYDANKGLTVGAAVECYKIYGDDNVNSHFSALNDSATLIGGTQIQGRASFGGNLCNAAPSGDSIPNMIAHRAVATITGPSGTREVPVEDICTGPGQTSIGSDELLISINFPSNGAGFGANYIRFIPRNEMDIAVAGVGASVTIEDGKFTSARVSLASVAPTPLLVEEAGEALVGQPVSEGAIQKAADLAKAAAKPISDMRGTADYRKHLCDVLTRRALTTAVERAQGAS